LLCPLPIPLAPANEEFKADMNTEDPRCFEVRPGPGVVITELLCWGFDSRMLRVNEAQFACNDTDTLRFDAPPRRANGYCVQVGAGTHNWAGFTLPIDE
jgi:hypothetical protein